MVLGSREQGAEEKHFRELGRNVIFLSGSREQRPHPLGEPQQCIVVFFINPANCAPGDNTGSALGASLSEGNT